MKMPEPAAVLHGGLKTGDAPVPLLGVAIAAHVRDLDCKVTISQRYANREGQPIEAVYVFPLDEGAAVCGFEALIDGVRVVGQMKEREQAFADYDDAMAAGHGAYLLDQERPDVFTASIGNLPPGKEVLVRISYVAELPVDADGVRFVLPTTVSPRYAPAEDLKGAGRTPAEAVNPPVQWQVPYGLDLDVTLEMASPILALESPSHPISVESVANAGRVRLATREAALDRDFVLQVRLAQPHQPRAVLERDARGALAVALCFQPAFTAEAGPCEAIFLVDRSGSMEGSSIEEATRALQLCLRSLPTGTRFNVVGFGSRFEQLFPESRVYDEASLALASHHVAGLRADLGGTEILAPLEAILKAPPRPGLPRQLFVLTDGQVSNTEAVLRLVRQHSVDTRVFTFGIGAGASAALVRGMARAGEGAAEFIAPGERVEARVLRQLGRALVPALTDVRVDWGGLKVRQAPDRVPPVFAVPEEPGDRKLGGAGRLLVHGFVSEPAAACEVTLHAVSPQGPLSWTLRVDPAAAREGNLVATLAARALIRELEEGQSPLHDRRGSLQARPRADEREKPEDVVKREIVQLGVTYGLASKHTSFVAVEERATPVYGHVQLRKVPVALTRGWGGTDREPMAGSGLGTGAWAAQAQFAAIRPMAAAPAPMAAAPRAAFLDAASAVLRKVKRAAPPSGSAPPAPAARPLDALVLLQRADGSWELSGELAGLIGRPLAELERLLRAASGPVETARRALATALALRWLETHAAAERAEWALLARKAERWLAGSGSQPASGTWQDAARA
jgi:Ca-activated chloride channel family protein